MKTPDRYRTLLTPQAQRDIRETVRYIARDLKAPASALKLQEDLEQAIASLETSPERFRIIDEEP